MPQLSSSIYRFSHLLFLVVVICTFPHFTVRGDTDKNLTKLLRDIRELQQANYGQIEKNNIPELIQAFTDTLEPDDQQIPELLDKWNDYLFRISRFSNEEYIVAIENQQLDYNGAVVKLNKRIEKTDTYRKGYSSKWIDDLGDKFGKGFVADNREQILDNFGAIIARNYHLYADELKNLIFIEAMLYGSYKEYFGMFLDFYKKEMSTTGQKQLKQHKEAAESLLDLTRKASIAQMYERLGLTEKMEENRAKNYSEELFVFFKEHPLSKYFDISKASDDLDAAIHNQGPE